MPTKEALRERIEMFESRVLGSIIRVLNLRMRAEYALADIYVNGVRKCNRRYRYSQFFKSSQLK